jgi:predicted metal-dependent hydrolase
MSTFPDLPIAPPAEYLAYVRLFNSGDYFEAHEVLEDLWVVEPGPLRTYYKGLIMMAVAILHWQRGNPNGARKLHRDARAYLAPYAPACEGLDVGDFLARLDRLFAPLQEWSPGHPVPPIDGTHIPHLELRG